MKKKAFTLVEVMAVVALISVLFVILVPRFGFATDKVKKVGVQTDFHAYETALRTVSLERGRLTNITSDQTSAADKSKALASAVNEYLDPELRIVANPDGSLSTPKKDPWQNPYGIGYSEASDALYVYSSGPDAKKDQAYDTVPTTTTGDDMIVSCRRGTLYLYGFGIDTQGPSEPVTTITGISVSVSPSKTAYLPGESFVSTGMEVVAIYSDGSESKITNFTVTDGANLQAGKSSVTISYVDANVSLTTTQPITVGNFLSSIAITKAPTKVNYTVGENFSDVGMVVTATYADKTTAAVTNYKVMDGTALIDGKSSVTISYTENKITKTATQAITTTSITLTSIAITKAPTKLNYVVGDSFNAAGMVVTATYSDKSTKAVTGYTITNGIDLTLTSNNITVSYTEGKNTKTASQAITVNKALSSIAITTPPTKVDYGVGDTFSSAGMVVTATYSDNSVKTVTDFTVGNNTNLAVSDKHVTISYTENERTKTTTQAITVTEVSLTSIAITKAPALLTYNIGDDFDRTGMVVTATYSDGHSAEVTTYDVNGTSLSGGRKNVTITYNERGITRQATQAITMINPLVQIAVTQQPSKTTYIVGEPFDCAGMIVTATYANWSTASVSGYTIQNGNRLELGTTSVTILYVENGMAKTTTQNITVTGSLASIRVTTNPKMVYDIGEAFDPTGMIVTATYANGSSSLVSGWVTDAKPNLPEGNTAITVHYTENSVSKSTVLTISAEKMKTTFYYSDGTTVIIDANGVLGSGYKTKNGATLTKVIIGKHVTTVGYEAFQGCTSLISVTIPNSVTTIGQSAFNGCTSLTSVTIPNSVTTIENDAFNRCTSLTSVNIPSSVTTIGIEAFFNCISLSSVTIPDGVTTIGSYAFGYCTSLTSVIIPNSVTTIRDHTFYGCTFLTSVTIPSNVITIGQQAFENCTSLASVIIPNSVTTILGSAFSCCTSLTSITIPNSVATIDRWAFANCSSLTVYYSGSSSGSPWGAKQHLPNPNP